MNFKTALQKQHSTTTHSRNLFKLLSKPPWQALSTASATGTDRSEISPYLRSSCGYIVTDRRCLMVEGPNGLDWEAGSTLGITAVRTVSLVFSNGRGHPVPMRAAASAHSAASSGCSRTHTEPAQTKPARRDCRTVTVHRPRGWLSSKSPEVFTCGQQFGLFLETLRFAEGQQLNPRSGPICRRT